MRPIIERLLPGASIITRPRLSQLEFAGDRKITRQPRRTAIVAFSADEVYAIAELIRRQHGGAAVVLGSLSPRTRNAQVAMFQNGDVDYLVATDAVGMGLNLDVDHVAFASDRKYDGYQFRRLNPSEFAQVAGRAGRATRDGTFGTTGRCAPFEPELVNALQNHTFDSVKVLQWRNSKLDFSSLGALQVSLALSPAHDALTRAPIAEDLRVLDHASRDAGVRERAHAASAVEKLWDTCQIPDYRKIAPAAHAELVTTVFAFLMKKGWIPDAWFAAQVEQADRTDGDIDTLSGRIAQIRTWTFAANRPDWLADPEHWQGITREVENKLSDALHERLTERFVDRRTSVLMRRLRENTMLNTEIGKTGEVIVEGHVIGRGIAFQLTEALGVIERSKIAAEMKDLDQPSRASLRKYGVRFGAYHIYFPALLKPAARALASLLWALKQDNVDMSALSGAQHMAGSGRTSFPVDKQLDRDAYRVLGYRQCGERAVRVDILERLADLIRPALAWREASPGAKPPGAFDGRGFVVTQAMTSLTGSAGEDFASILRALGYRMERRPAPPPKPAVVEPVAADAAPAELASETLSEAAAIEAVAASGNAISQDTPVASGSAESSAVAPSTEESAASSATLLPDVSFLPDLAATEPVEAKAEAESSLEEPSPAPQQAQQDNVAAAVAPDAVTADPAVASSDAAAAPEAPPPE